MMEVESFGIAERPDDRGLDDACGLRVFQWPPTRHRSRESFPSPHLRLVGTAGSEVCFVVFAGITNYLEGTNAKRYDGQIL